MTGKTIIKLGDRLRHTKTGRCGVYSEHVNRGGGYMVMADDGEEPRLLCGAYEDFELIDVEQI